MMNRSQKEGTPKVIVSLTTEGYFFEYHRKKIGSFSRDERESVDFLFRVAERLGVTPKRVLDALIRLPRRDSHDDAEDRVRENRCGNCLLYTTPKCFHAHVRELVFENDVACCDFYPLEKRLGHFRQHVIGKRRFEKAVENL
jgi:hypothetical protein